MWRGLFRNEKDKKSEGTREYEEQRYKRDDGGN